jgi:hypothetical protein
MEGFGRSVILHGTEISTKLFVMKPSKEFVVINSPFRGVFPNAALSNGKINFLGPW